MKPLTAKQLKDWRTDTGLGVIRAARLIINPATGKPVHWRTLQRWESGERGIPFWLTRKVFRSAS